MVKRRTISLPDELDARLERLQDRINVSRVCAAALNKEIEMLEAVPAGAEADVQRVLRRLQTVKERWYERGRRDGRRWAVDAAAREELRWAGETMAGQDGATIAALAHDRLRVNHGAGARFVPHPSPQSTSLGAVPAFPKSFPVDASLNTWRQEDALAAEDAAERDTQRDAQRDAEADPAGRGGETDEAAYWSGWRDAAAEIWKAVAPSLA